MNPLTLPRRTVDDAGTDRPAPVLLIGLDGAAFSILDPLLTDGTMPELARLTAAGNRAVLESTAHPLSPPAWSSIITGCPPGEHGIFDFVRVGHDTGRPAYTLISAADLRAPTVFELVSGAGLTATALNFPAMFPPPRIRGCVVPGYVPASYLGRACWPRDLFADLVADGIDPGRLAVDWELERTAVQGLDADQLTHWVELHIEREQQWAEIAARLMRTRPADLTAVVLDGVDRIQHLCLHLLIADPGDLDPAARRTRSRCLDYFRLVDRTVGRMVGAAGPDATVIVVSDHGSEPAGPSIFYANSWLEQQGLLRWADGVPVDTASRLALNGNSEAAELFDWTATSAAALTSSSNAIVVHRAGGPGRPGVTAEEYPAFCRRLADALLEVRDPETGEPVVDRVLLGSEAFPGRHQDQAPDLTLVLHQPGFLSVLRGPEITAPRRTPYGTHHRDGILVAAGAGIAEEIPARLSVVDVAPTVLTLLGLAVPATMTGTPVPGLVRSARAAAGAAIPSNSIQAQSIPAQAIPADAGAAEQPALDAAGEAEIMARLRRLGYLE